MPISPFQRAEGPYPRERRYRRFDLQFPVRVSFPSGSTVQEIKTVSRNISIGGLLLRSTDSLPPHTRVKVTMDVQGPPLRRLVRLVSEGEVVRVEPLEAGAEFAIAIECKHPIDEVEDYLPATG
jgi:PilZ domain